MGFTISEANSILRSKFVASGLYMGLSTTSPNDDGSNFTEPTESSGYARAPIGNKLTNSSNKQVQNSEILFFNLSRSGGYGTVTHFGVFTSSAATTPFFTGALDAPITIPEGYVPIFDFGALKIGLDKEALE